MTAVAARSIWNGALTFGDVVVPVKLYPATEDRSVHFHEVRLGDGCRIVHRRVGAESGREVPAERVAKAYATSRGHQIVLDDDEIAAARGPSPKVIEIEHFTVSAQIDPVYYDRPYVVGAGADGERPYRVLLAALERTGVVGIGRVVLRTREQLVALRPRGDALMLHTMRFADEVLDGADLKVPPLRQEPSTKEITMAKRLIAALETDWRPARHRDRYRGAVLELIERKAAGAKIEPPAKTPRETPDDLLAALKASLDGSKRPPRRSRRRTPAPRRTPTPGGRR